VTRRGTIGALVLLAWIGGVAAFARRELERGPAQRLAEAAMRVSPGAVFYRVSQGASQIGYASSRIDTVPGGIKVNDYMVVDVPLAGRTHRTTAQASAHLTRALALRDFSFVLESDSTALSVSGRTVGDSLLDYTIAHGREVVDSQRVAIDGPILLPTLLPLAVVLGERPKVGRTYSTASFDLMAMAPRTVNTRVTAESLFTVVDSAAYDQANQRWGTAHRDTVRAWLIEAERPAGSESGARGLRAWVDEQGRIVEMPELLGFGVKRTAYELAFEEWRAAHRRGGEVVASDRDVLESTAIAAGRSLSKHAEPSRLTVRLHGVSLDGFDLDGNSQRLRGDTLGVERAKVPENAGYKAPRGLLARRDLLPYLRAEPLLESGSQEIRQLAARLARGTDDPRVVAERLSQWVHDSLKKVVTVSVPSALQVLRVRSGDCNEHTQLYVALARAAGIPSRGAAGLAFIDGKFYYHAWPEVFLGEWIPVDPTFGQFPADAAHLRFVYGGLAQQAELIRLMGLLRIDVLENR
jgi:hypothetical protein